MEVNFAGSSKSDIKEENITEENVKLLPKEDVVKNYGSLHEVEDKVIIIDKASKTSVGLQKELTLYNSVALVIGEVVGSGIFISSTQVLQYSGSFGFTLIFWIVGGLIAMCGGLAYAELGVLVRNSGGEYAYLREGFSFNKKRPAYVVFGNTLGFLYTWSFIVMIRPGSTAVAALAFGTYLAQAVAGGGPPPDISVKLLAVSAVMFLSFINVYSLRATATIINMLSSIKILALLFVSALGIWQLVKGDHTDNFTNAFEGTTTCPGDIALAFYSVLWAYDGWGILAYSVEETKNLEKNLPRGIIIALILITVCYLFVNIAYFAGLNKSEILSSTATALTFGHVTLGEAGLVVIPLLVATSTIGAVASGVYSGSRVQYATSRDGNFLEMFSGIHNIFKTPVAATIFQGLLAIILIFAGSVTELINGVSALEWVFYGLVFIALLVMRFTKRHEKRPFKVWFIIPLVMILVAVFLIAAPLVLVPNQRISTLIGLFLILLGIPVYYIFIWERYRPQIFNKISEKLTSISNLLLDSSTSSDILSHTIQ